MINYRNMIYDIFQATNSEKGRQARIRPQNYTKNKEYVSNPSGFLIKDMKQLNKLRLSPIDGIDMTDNGLNRG